MSMISLSDKIKNIEESATLAMARKSRELQKQGENIINLSLGEPDFNTPDFIKTAAQEAIQNNFSKYTPVAGYTELLEIISRKFQRDNKLNYSPNQIICSTGAKQSIAQLLMVLLNNGDEVILPSPYWVSYAQMVQLAGGQVKKIHTTIENNFKITATDLERSISTKSKVFLFSSPCNPSGSVYSEKELTELALVLKKHKNIIIISDEIYEHINFTNQHFSIGRIKSLQNQVVTINGLSKGYAMTGWRFGYLGGPEKIVKACIKMQGQITSATCSITQRAAMTALKADPTCTHIMRNQFKKRRDLMISLLSNIKDIEVNQPEGAFYIFPNIYKYIGRKNNSRQINSAEDLTMYLLEDAGVSTVSGSAFGNDHYIRISYAANEKELIQACTLIKTSLDKLK